MQTLQIDIINPKASKLLKNLVDLNLIAITNKNNNEIIAMANKIRNKIKTTPTLAEITKEVEIVKAKRLAAKKN